MGANLVEYVGSLLRKASAYVLGSVLKKIEQEVSKECHYSEYLTLLNTS